MVNEGPFVLVNAASANTGLPASFATSLRPTLARSRHLLRAKHLRAQAAGSTKRYVKTVKDKKEGGVLAAKTVIAHCSLIWTIPYVMPVRPGTGLSRGPSGSSGCPPSGSAHGVAPGMGSYPSDSFQELALGQMTIAAVRDVRFQRTLRGDRDQ